MEIRHLGHSSFRIKFKNKMVLVTDPFDPALVGLSFENQKADLVTISHDHRDHNFVEGITGSVVREETFVIRERGEYEVGGVEVIAVKSFHDKKMGKARGINLMMVIRQGGITVCHLGDLGESLGERKLEEVGSVDVLLVPVGGEYTIDAGEAGTVIDALNPSIVIPMHYKVSGMTAGFEKLGEVNEFLTKNSLEVILRGVDRVRLEPSSLPENTKVVVLDG